PSLGYGAGRPSDLAGRCEGNLWALDRRGLWPRPGHVVRDMSLLTFYLDACAGSCPWPRGEHSPKYQEPAPSPAEGWFAQDPRSSVPTYSRRSQGGPRLRWISGSHPAPPTSELR